MSHKQYLWNGQNIQENERLGANFDHGLLYCRHRSPSSAVRFGTLCVGTAHQFMVAFSLKSPLRTVETDRAKLIAAGVSTTIRKREMANFHDAAYTMAAMSATVALLRALVKKGVLTRDEAVRALLDEAVARAIQAEAQGEAKATNEVNRQSAEILKFIAEKL
ncbi:MAG TPA: hypothetical protein VKD43_07475 [Xanthobacteraceae bacterium]|nr:hypothetical protein [Xanthobacteraceae bacterium]